MVEDIVLENNLCAGCGICESIFGKEKISVSLNEQGFLRPSFNQKLSLKEEVVFKEVCPGITAKHNSRINHNTLWGPYLSISAGHANNEKTRYFGSSGGVLTALASYVLDTKKVDCVVHMGASESHPYRNEFKVSHTSEEVISNAGSRYAPSATLINIVEILEQYGTVAIIGKPCDIVGMRNYMSKNSVAEEKIKFLFSFMCAGVPSQKGTQQIIENFDLKEENVISLRYRGEGWPGYFKITDNQKKVHKITYNESWGSVLNKHLQFRCKICADGTGEFADITCADAWESSENGYPSFEEKKGKSLIIIRNTEGQKVMQEAIESGYVNIDTKSISRKEIEQMQPYQKLRKQNLIARLAALKLFGKSVPNYNYKILMRAALKENPLILIKNFLGMVKRLL